MPSFLGQRQTEKALIVVKSDIHLSVQHGETVCVAGLAEDGTWRRLYPIKFRKLPAEQKFTRWDWVEYRFEPSDKDRRPESRPVLEGSISIVSRNYSEKLRPEIVEKSLRSSFQEADALGETLCMIRPTEVEFVAKKKSPTKFDQDRKRFERHCAQRDFFYKDLPTPSPCPYEFRVLFRDGDGNKIDRLCDDWETNAAFYKLSKSYPEHKVIETLKRRYSEEYPHKGMALAFGTHSQRPWQWLLVGIVRVDPLKELSLF
nr:hypothetical protein [uncultured Cohaesibacter sp.]